MENIGCLSGVEWAVMGPLHMECPRSAGPCVPPVWHQECPLLSMACPCSAGPCVPPQCGGCPLPSVGCPLSPGQCCPSSAWHAGSPQRKGRFPSVWGVPRAATKPCLRLRPLVPMECPSTSTMFRCFSAVLQAVYI